MENNYGNEIKAARLMQFLLASLTLLHCVYSINERWCPKPCKCYNDFQTSYCSQRILTHLPQFSNLTKRIYAENNKIEDLSYKTLGNLNNLVTLNLENNSLTNVDFNVFCGLKKIIEINLSGNKIEVFSTNVELPSSDCRLSRLTILHLNSNKLTVIPSNLSYIAPYLKKLNLAYNYIHSLKLDEDFSNLIWLRTLDISGNPLNDIGSDDLMPLSSLSLESLKISECAIYNISRDALQGLSNLTSLSLSRNLIYPKTLQEAFSGLAEHNRLQHLDLSEMMLSSVTDLMLSTLINLKSLDISHSNVRTIQPALFISLSKMEIINLEKNFLSKIDGINRMHRLTKLYLRDNKIQEINLTGLNSLEIVDLSGNLLSVLPQNWLAGIETLNVLNLSNNDITTINHRAFKNVALHTLDLSHNKLTTFHRYGLVKVQSLYLSHNKMHTLTDNAFDNMEAILEELDLSYNDFREFPMLIDRDFLALQRLNFRHNQLGEALRRKHLEGLLKSLTHLQVLDLSYNQIVSIPVYQVRNLHHLTTLLLEGNLIIHLEDLGISQLNSLAKLVVSDNLLQTVDANMLDEMDYLEVMDLSENPFECSCKLIPLQSWLNTTLIMILNNDKSKYQCETPSELKHEHIQTVYINPNDCNHTTELTLKLKLQIAGALFGTLFVLVLLSVLVCYYRKICHQIKTIQYKWQVRYREVSSAGAEYAGDNFDQDVTERLTVENVYSQKINT